MLKYHRLSQSSDENIDTASEKTITNAIAKVATTTTVGDASAPVGDNDEFSMFFTLSDNDDDSNNNKQRLKCSQTSINNNNKNFNYNNNFKTTTTRTTNIDMLEATDESTMEVPLLNCNNNMNNNNNKEEYHDHDLFDRPSERHCLCDQPGFGVQDKSTKDAKMKIFWAIAMCLVFMIIEFIGGYLAGSLAIVTDAAHLASDCIAFVIGLVSISLGSKPPDERLSFGYKRMEVLGAIISIMGIWILTVTLVIMAVQRIVLNDFDLDTNTMMIISGIGILINIAMIYVLHGSPTGHSHHGHGHAHGHSHGQAEAHMHLHSHATAAATTTAPTTTEVAINLANGLKHTVNGSAVTPTAAQERNLNVRAALIHVIGDLVQSVGVFLAAVLIHFYPNAKFADPLCTLLFSIIVILTTVQLFRESVRILMDAVPPGVSLIQLADELGHIEGVHSVHHLNVWNHTTNHSILMAHLVIDFLSDSNVILSKATQLASQKFRVKHCTIQIERLTPAERLGST